jgi:hypothetical protein
MGLNLYGSLMLVFTILKYSRATFTYCSQYHMIYYTRGVEIQQNAKVETHQGL